MVDDREAHCPECNGSGYRPARLEEGSPLAPCPRGCKPRTNADPRDTRIAELEKEVARYRSLDRKHFHDTFNGGYLLSKTHQAFHRGMDTVFNALDAIAKDPSPPAPVPACTGLDGECCKPGGHLGDCESTDDLGAWAKDPRPPEADEPAIVQYLRRVVVEPKERMGWALSMSYVDAEALLAFIDSRKAAVSILDLEAERRSHDATTRQLSDEQGERRKVEQERDRLRTELARVNMLSSKERAEHVDAIDEWREVVDGKQRQIERLRGELDACEQHMKILSEEKARPVVDVARWQRIPLAQGWWFRLNDKSWWQVGPTTNPGAWAASEWYGPVVVPSVVALYESNPPGYTDGSHGSIPKMGPRDEQPASAKADEKCPRCGGSCFVRDLYANGAKVPCPECQTPMPSADPSRVGEEEQERLRDLAAQALGDAIERPHGGRLAEAIDAIERFCNGEREGRASGGEVGTAETGKAPTHR